MDVWTRRAASRARGRTLSSKPPTRLAIVGCGFVADFYVRTLANYPHLELMGVTDREPARADRLAKHYGLRVYRSLDEALDDARVDIVLNLTNPRSHFSVSQACVAAGKHVYSEKPLATDFSDAMHLVELATARGVRLASAPCGVLGEAAQTAWRSLRRNEIGPVRLVYAELDDGLIHRMNYRTWHSDSGSPWPWQDEFEVGCTLEHAGYYVTWLVAFFGPAVSVTSFASCQVTDKQTDVPLPNMAADFSSACIQFRSGVVARLTCSILAPHDHRLRIFGDDGILTVDECWHYESAVTIKRRTRLALWAEKYALLSMLPGLAARRQPLARGAPWPHRYAGTHHMDFARGVAELADAIHEQRPCRLAMDFSLHVNEIVLAVQYPDRMGSPRQLLTQCAPMLPMAWAMD